MTEYRRAFEVNFWGPVQVVQAMTPLLRASKGRIINTTSGSVYITIPCTPRIRRRSRRSRPSPDTSAWSWRRSALRSPASNPVASRLRWPKWDLRSKHASGLRSRTAAGAVPSAFPVCGHRDRRQFHIPAARCLCRCRMGEGHLCEAPETFVPDRAEGCGSAVVAPPAPSPAGREHLAPHVQQEERCVAEMGTEERRGRPAWFAPDALTELKPPPPWWPPGVNASRAVHDPLSCRLDLPSGEMLDLR